MGQSVRQAARVRALEIQRRARAERQAAIKRCEALGVEIAMALAERDALVERYELAAASALVKLANEGVSASGVSDWVPGLSAGEIRRLRKLADEATALSAGGE